MNVLIIGYFGSGNLGDEAILQGFVEWARGELPGAKLTVLSSAPVATARQYNVEAVGKTQWFKLLRALTRADDVVAPGGSILQDATSLRSLLYYAGIARLARLFARRVFFLNQGVGPLSSKTSRRIAAKAASSWASLFTLRDGESARLLVGLGAPWKKLTVRGDTSLLLSRYVPDRAPGAPRAAKKLRVGVSLRPHAGTDSFAKLLLAALAEEGADAVALRVLPFEKEDDEPSRSFTRQWEWTCPGVPLRMGWREPAAQEPTPLEALAVIQTLDLVIGMRLHSLIFAAMCGVPFVGVSYDPKVQAFCESAGQPCYVLAGEDRPDELRQKIRDGLAAAREPRGAASAASHMRTQTMIQTRAMLAGLAEFKRELRRYETEALEILGVPVSPRGFREAVEFIEGAISAGKTCHVVTLNPEMIMRARRDVEFARVLHGAELLTADGVGVRLAVRAKYRRKIESVSGIELVEYLLSISKRRGYRFYLLGGSKETVGGCAKALASWAEPPEIAGFHHGYLDPEEEKKAVEHIKRVKPHVLLVGMGSPKQENWIARFGTTLGVPALIGVGGTFDVLSGKTRRAPALMRRLGLEWLYRLVRQPGRMRRMAVLPAFALHALAEALAYRIKGAEPASHPSENTLKDLRTY
ncbi:MAG: polysaccharide pyruvyl transferase CsaB [bacterium]